MNVPYSGPKLPMLRPVLLALCSLLLVPSLKSAPTGPELAARLDHVRRPDRSFEVQLNITEMHNGKTTQESALRVMARKSPDSPHFDAVTSCLGPAADKGKTVLTTANEVWFQDPKARNPTRLSAQHFRGKFFVGDALSTSFAADYDAEIVGEETVQDASKKDAQCYRLKMKLKQPGALTPDLIEYWVDKKLLQPIKGQFYTAKGKLLRTSYYAAYAKVFDELRPTRVLVVSNTERGVITDIKFTNFKLTDWKDEMFTKDALERVVRGELP